METEYYFRLKQHLHAIRVAEKEIVEQLDLLEEMLDRKHNLECIREHLKQSR